MKTLSSHGSLNRLAVFALSGGMSLAQAAFCQNQQLPSPQSPLPAQVEDANPARTACLKAITRSGDIANLCLRLRTACQRAIKSGGVLAPGLREDAEKLSNELGWVFELDMGDHEGALKVRNITESLLQKLDSPDKRANEAWLGGIVDSLTRLNRSLNGYCVRMSPRFDYCIAEKTGEDAGSVASLLTRGVSLDRTGIEELKTNLAAWKDAVRDTNLASLLLQLDLELNTIKADEPPQKTTVREISRLAQALSEIARENSGLGYSYSLKSAPAPGSFKSKQYPLHSDTPEPLPQESVKLEIKQLALKETWMVRLPPGDVFEETQKAIKQSARQLGTPPSSLEWVDSIVENGSTKAIVIRRH